MVYQGRGHRSHFIIEINCLTFLLSCMLWVIWVCNLHSEKCNLNSSMCFVISLEVNYFCSSLVPWYLCFCYKELSEDNSCDGVIHHMPLSLLYFGLLKLKLGIRATLSSLSENEWQILDYIICFMGKWSELQTHYTFYVSSIWLFPLIKMTYIRLKMKMNDRNRTINCIIYSLCTGIFNPIDSITMLFHYL